jgi:hypothetical protein
LPNSLSGRTTSSPFSTGRAYDPGNFFRLNQNIPPDQLGHRLRGGG